jgi:hypothetical protein
MQKAIRLSPRRDAAVIAAASRDERRRALYWLAFSLLLSSVLAAAEIRSEALTVGALSSTADHAGAAQPALAPSSRSTTVAGSFAGVGYDKN